MSSVFFNPPPTAQTELSRKLKFGMKGPQAKLFSMTKAIFAMSPPKLKYRGGFPLRGGKNWEFFFQISNFFDSIDFFKVCACQKKSPYALS